jgi:hypothetical protein
MSGLPAHISDEIAEHLDAIGRLFKAPKLTLLVRNPDVPGDADLVMTDDDLQEAIVALGRRLVKGSDG